MTQPASTGGSALERLKARVQRLPDPTHLFLAHVAIILAVHAARADLLRTWVARILLPPGLLLSVFAAALWRRPTAHHASAAAGNQSSRSSSRGPPPGVVPDPVKLVRTGEALRKQDSKVAEDEADLRRGQLRLEMLRKEIESRLPNASSVSERSATANSAATSALPPPFNTTAGIHADSTERNFQGNARLSPASNARKSFVHD